VRNQARLDPGGGLSTASLTLFRRDGRWAMRNLEGIQDSCPELTPSGLVHMDVRQAPFCEEFSGIFQKAVVGRVALKRQPKFDTDDGYSGFNTFPVDSTPDKAYFLRAEYGRVKSMLEGIPVARLSTTLSFLHTYIIVHMFDGGNRELSCTLN
jgi:hypothetical protein